MANNINTLTTNSEIFKNKLSELAKTLNIINQSSSMGQTKEELVIQANKTLSAFYSRLDASIFNPTKDVANTAPNLIDYNTNLLNILSDLRTIFLELTNISSLVVSNFNFIVSDSNKLISKLKNIDSRFADYILYSTDQLGTGVYFSDSFNDLLRVDNNSSLLNNDQCFIDHDQGIVQLPLNTNTQSVIKINKLPVINSNSNGNIGNNYEAGARSHSDISVVIDGNPDTWFEYERVLLNADDHQPLILDLTIDLDATKVINFININPNNFGTKYGLKISSIETSVDGQNYISIKDDIPLSSFKTEDEENVFTLSPSTSKFSGEGVYSFLPRLSRYVHITIEQNTPYTIIDNSGTSRLRYAIGLRDINIENREYKDIGEIISATYTIDQEIKKIALRTTQSPIESSPLASIEHYVSVDDGLSWNRLNPINFLSNDTSIPNILNFNLLDDGSITTSASVKSIKYKAVLKRDSNAFSGNSLNIKTKKQSVTELYPVPVSTPFGFDLKNALADDIVTVIHPGFFSRGFADRQYKLGTGNDAALQVKLPFGSLNKTLIKDYYYTNELTTPEVILVNGIKWTRGQLVNAGPIDTIYEIDSLGSQIKFGNGINGAIIPAGAPVEMYLRAERLPVCDRLNNVDTLQYSTSSDKGACVITQFGHTVFTVEPLKKNVKTQILEHKYILPNSLTVTDSDSLQNEVQYLNGYAELTLSGDYSVDYANGVLFSYDSTDTDLLAKISYRYKSYKVLDTIDWEFVNDGFFNKISILESGFLSIKVTNENLDKDNKYANLKNASILRGSVVFNGTSAGSVFKREVNYIDGTSELNAFYKTTEQLGSLQQGIVTYKFRTLIASNNVTFSNTDIFVTQVFALDNIVAAGQYYIDISNNSLSVYISGNTQDAGSVSYLYHDNNANNSGVYSINYDTGEIFASSNIPNNITVNYLYTHYEVSYNIARFVDSDDISIDKITNTISLNEREILKRNSFNNSSNSNFYQIVYNTFTKSDQNLSELEKYFSPVLKDYALQVITDSLLIL